MVGKLNRLPADTQEALKQFACMGNSAEFDMLAMAYRDVGRGTSPTPLGSSTVRTHLPLGRFLSIPARSRAGSGLFHDSARAARRGASAHRHASRPRTLLRRNARRQSSRSSINSTAARTCITSVEDRERVADLNLIAGRRAKISTAYDSALKYLRAGRALADGRDLGA